MTNIAYTINGHQPVMSTYISDMPIMSEEQLILEELDCLIRITHQQLNALYTLKGDVIMKSRHNGYEDM